MSPTSGKIILSQPTTAVADVLLYPTCDNGNQLTAQMGWGCPCFCAKSPEAICYDGWPILREPLAPGDRRRVGFVFLSGEEAVAALRRAGTFYLWEGRFIGEATVQADSETAPASR